MSRKKKFMITAGILIVIGAVLGILSSQNGEDKKLIQADIAYFDDISEIVNANGRIQPRTKVDITAEVSAEIIDLYVKEGDEVKKGQELLLLDTVQLQSDVTQARYSLEEIIARKNAAKAQFEKDKKEFDRQSSLYDQGLSSDNLFTNAKYAFENSKANFEAMSAQVKTAQARLDKAEDNLTKTLIKSPMDGIIIYHNVEIGEIAQAQTSFTQGKTLMTVADLSSFEVEVDIEETEIANLRLNQSTEIRIDAFKDSVFTGFVEEIGNSALVTGQGTENYATTFKVKIGLDPTEASIRPGMTATVDITTAISQDALVIPYASVVSREFDPDSLEAKSTEKAKSGEVVAADLDSNAKPEKKYHKKEMIKKSGVYIVQNGVVQFVEVKTGIADDKNIVALTGINPGDTVASGSFQTLRNLKEGDAVTIDSYSEEKMKDLSD